MRILLFLLIQYFSVSAWTQQPAYFLFGEQQFEGVDIYNIIQDNDGDYWFATDDGLYHHDGYSFEKLELDEMKSVSVFNFTKDGLGRIYCNNLNQQVFMIENGECRFIFEILDLGNDVSMEVNANNFLVINSGRNIYVLDSNQRLVSRTNNIDGYLSLLSEPMNGHISAQRSGSNTLFQVNLKGEILVNKLCMTGIQTSFSTLTLTFMKLNKQEYAVDALENKYYRFNPVTLELCQIIPSTPSHKLNSCRFYTIGEEVWIAGSIGGVKRIRREADFFATDNIFYGDQFVSDVFLDMEENVLVSTFDAGVLVLPNLEVDDVIRELKDYNITRIAPSNAGSLIFGTKEGQLLLYKNGVIEILSEKGSKAIEFVYKSSNQPLVFSDNFGFSIINLQSKKSIHPQVGGLKDIAALGGNQYLLAMNIGAIEIEISADASQILSSQTLFSGRTYAIEREKKSNTIYLSSSSGLMYKTSNDSFKEILWQGNPINATCLIEVGECVYASTRKNGILRLQKGKIIEQLLPKMNGETLVAKSIAIHKDYIFANTSLGLAVLNKKGKMLTFLNKASGLSTNKIIDFCVQNNLLWIVHSRGVQKFTLASITAQPRVPNLRLRTIYVNDQALASKSSKHQFSSEERKFRFVLQALSLRHRENIHYHYKLEGLESHWHIQPYASNEITYNALAPGNYRLVIKAENNGAFCKPIYYSFTISEPFYQRWWFNVGCIFVFLFGVYILYRRQLSIQRKKAQQINELNASRLTAIQSQMNPHFIFNSLNSIQDLVLKGDVDNSYTFITKFSNLVRRTLNYSDKDFIPFENEIKLIELYLSLEKLRFKDDLIYEIETNGIDDIFIPPMLIQPFIENALVHGLLHQEGQKRLEIVFSMENELLICTITDNGVGRRKAREIKERQRSSHESFAVNAIKKRFEILEHHFQGKLGFSYVDSETGTRVVLRIPFHQKF